MAFEWLLGSSPKVEQLQRFNPQQLQQQQGLFNQAQGFLRNPINIGSSYAPIAQEARTNFATQTVPMLAERFTALGGSGTQRSSAYPATLGAAGAQLERGLAADQARFGLQEQGLRLQQQGQMYNLLQNLLGQSFTPTYEHMITQGRQGLLGSLLPAAGAALGSYLGAPAVGAGLSGVLGNINQQYQPQVSPLDINYNYRLGGNPLLNGLGPISSTGAGDLYSRLGLGGF